MLNVQEHPKFIELDDMLRKLCHVDSPMPNSHDHSVLVAAQARNNLYYYIQSFLKQAGKANSDGRESNRELDNLDDLIKQ